MCKREEMKRKQQRLLGWQTQGIKGGRDSTLVVAETGLRRAMATGAPYSLTTADASFGFAFDILIRTITAGQPDLLLK